jgi:hypothetical protein
MRNVSVLTKTENPDFSISHMYIQCCFCINRFSLKRETEEEVVRGTTFGEGAEKEVHIVTSVL